MHLIFCVDDKDGVSFCGRRLSRDREVYDHILRICAGHSLWTAPESAALFPEGTIHVDKDYLSKAGADDYCFLESLPPKEIWPKAESVILYNWNRHYPSTEKFPRECLLKMKINGKEEFPGNSHDKLTMERYTL